MDKTDEKQVLSEADLLSTDYGTSPADDGASLISESDEEAQQSKAQLILGVFFCCLFIVGTMLSIPCLQLLGHDTMPAMQLIFYGSLANFVLVLPLLSCARSVLLTLDRQEATALAALACVSGVAQAMFYIAAEILPAGVLGAVGQCSLLVGGVVLTTLVTKSIGRLTVLATTMCVIGLGFFLVSTFHDQYLSPSEEYPGVGPALDPAFGANDTFSGDKRSLVEVLWRMGRGLKSHSRPHSVVYEVWAYILLIISSVMMAIVNLVIHTKFSSTSFYKILLFFVPGSLITSFLFMFAIATPIWKAEVDAPDKYLPLAGFLFLYVVESMSLYACWQRISSPVFGLLSASSVVFYFIIQYTVVIPDIHVGSPDVFEILGAVFIFAGMIIGPVAEMRYIAERCRRRKEETVEVK